MTHPADIRPIEDEDVPGAAAALVEVHAADGYPVEGVAAPEQWIRPPGVIQAWVAKTDRIVGHVALLRAPGAEGDDHGAALARLFVVPDARRNTVGERLVAAAMDYAREHRMLLVLDVMVKDSSAIRLYERLGWKRTGETTYTYGDHQQTPASIYIWPAD